MFQQTAAQWDMNAIDRYPPPDERYFILALFVVCVVVTVKILRIWLLAPPFRRALPATPPNYRKKLQLCINALTHWRWLPVFFWLFLSSHRLYILFVGFEIDKTIPISVTMGNLQELAKFLSFALSAVFYVFLLRWNVLIRLTKLRD
jgi:hypothetical protein